MGLLLCSKLAVGQQSIADTGPDVVAETPSLQSEVLELRREVESSFTAPRDLLPPPVDPQRILGTEAVRRGEFRGAFVIPGTDVSLRIGGYLRADAIYDTGFVASGIQLFPATVAIDGSALAARRGRTQLSGSQSRLNFDAQAKTDFGQLRGFIELDFLKDGSDPRMRHAFGEWRGENWDLIGGQTWTTFMDPGALPSVIPETTAAGAIFSRQPQFRLTRRWNECASFAIAIEQAVSNDFTLPNPLSDQRLERWPDFVARFRLVRKEVGTLQIASLVRGIGFVEASNEEHFVTGWGASITMRRQVFSGPDNIRAGVAGGHGIGSYLTGLRGDLSAAAPDLDGFRTLGAIGTYGAYQHFWSEEFRSSLYYGYTHVESTPLMPDTTGTQNQNTGVNLIWSPRPTFGIGIEYTYVIREVRDGTTGDNHRVQFAIQFGP
jgi:hypothetical protein